MVAERALTDISSAFEQLAKNPGIGHLREDLTPHRHIKFWSVGPSLIAYRNAEKYIEILFIERATRDWKLLMEEYIKKP